MKTAAILLAAGSGSRMRGRVQDKVLAPLAGIPVLAHSLRAFRAGGIAEVFVFVARDEAQRAAIAAAAKAEGLPADACLFTFGGAERQDSVCNGLDLLGEDIGCVFIHDCARPLIRPDSLRALKTAALRDGGAVLAHRVVDTIKKVDPPTPLENRQLQDLDRKTLWAMETPQVFRRDLIARCYANVRAQQARVTDDTAALAREGHPVTLVENIYPNPKITLPEDLDFVEWLLARPPQAS